MLRYNRFDGWYFLCYLLLTVLLFIPLPGFCSTAIDNVYLIVIDGVRPDILKTAYTPNLDALKENGAYTPNAWTVFPATTLAAIPALHTGAPPEVHGVTDWHGQIHAHTLTEVFQEAGKTVVLVRQSGITGNYQADHATGLWYPGWVDNPDNYFVNRALALIDEYEPFFLNLYSSTPDNRGHRYGHDSVEYQKAIELVDEELGIFFDGLKNRGLFDNALIIVTTDHGMTGHMHSLGYDTDMRIFSIWYGPYIRKGHVIPDTVSLPAMPAGSVTVDVKSILSHDWSAESVSWNDQPEMGDTIASCYVDGLGWYSWDITGYLNETEDERLSIAMTALEDENSSQYQSVFFNTQKWWTNNTYLEIEIPDSSESNQTLKIYPDLEVFLDEEIPWESIVDRENFYIGRNYYLEGRMLLGFSLEDIALYDSIEKATLKAYCWRRWPPEGYESTAISHKIIDIVPTIAFLTQFPSPADSQGRVVTEILEEPSGRTQINTSYWQNFTLYTGHDFLKSAEGK